MSDVTSVIKLLSCLKSLFFLHTVYTLSDTLHILMFSNMHISMLFKNIFGLNRHLFIFACELLH
jgi:hypothetical protein